MKQCDMELGNETLPAEQVQKLADELSPLSKQQSKPLQTAAYISMSAEEAHN